MSFHRNMLIFHGKLAKTQGQTGQKK